jgi:hypothetical protein
MADDEGTYTQLPPQGFPGFDPREWQGNAGEGQPEAQQTPEALQLTDDTLVTDPEDGEIKPWKEIKRERLNQSSFTRKTQELARQRKEFDAKLAEYEPYDPVLLQLRTNPKFRNYVQEGARTIIGVGGAAAPVTPPPTVTNEEFDEDPARAVNKVLSEQHQALRREIHSRQPAPTAATSREDLQRIVDEQVANRLLQEVLDDCGEHREAVRARAEEKALAMSEDDRSRLDQDTSAMRRFVRDTYREVVGTQEQTIDEVQPVSTVNRAAPTPGTIAVRETPATKSWWSASDEDFEKTVKNVTGVG